uniref:Uncharacterized protein n=1 Tax=Arundo donax TaxID=35708 RepID=A0A0A9AMV7_ARUDO
MFSKMPSLGTSRMSAVYCRGLSCLTDNWQLLRRLRVCSAIRPLLGSPIRTTVRSADWEPPVPVALRRRSPWPPPAERESGCSPPGRGAGGGWIVEKAAVREVGL